MDHGAGTPRRPPPRISRRVEILSTMISIVDLDAGTIPGSIPVSGVVPGVPAGHSVGAVSPRAL